jgi:SAM-dependent methyltransferase
MTTLSFPLRIHQAPSISEVFSYTEPTESRRRHDPTIWSAFHIGMRLKTGADRTRVSLATNLARVSYRPRRLSRALTPIDLVRWREFDFAFKAISRHMRRPRHVLDISSPKLLPLTIASRIPGCNVTVTDILQREVDWTRISASKLALKNVHAHVEDARSMSFDSNRFDLITSISVFEHIAPEHGGEIPAVQEMARVLAPGGIAVLTVPFSHKYFADYQKGSVYERTATSDKPIFFQRFYDMNLLQRNIVDASGLELLSLTFIDERHFLTNPRRRMAHFVNGTPRQVFWFGPTYPLLAHFFLSQPKPLEACVKPYIACLILRKQDGPSGI